MKRLPSLLLAVSLALVFVWSAQAQTPESVWLSAAATTFKPADTVSVSVNAISGTPIQGFSIQIRYDPACLQPTETTTPIPGMNLLSLPQIPGLLESTFASTTPQIVNGVIADVHFTALAQCQTALTLEKVDLAVKSPEGIAVPVIGLTMGQQTVDLTVGPGAPVTAVPTGEAAPAGGGIPVWAIVLLALLVLLIVFVVFKLVRPAPKGPRNPAS
jgi:hypothetical protein